MASSEPRWDHRHSPGSLEQYLIPSDAWDREIPGIVRIEGIIDEGSYPTGYGRHPEDGWFVLGAGQGPFIIWAEWKPVVELLDFNAPEPNPLRPIFIEVLDRLRTHLQDTNT